MDITALYNSTSRPDYKVPDIRCPIAAGDEFGAIVTITGIPVPPRDRWITVGICLLVEGYKEWAVGLHYLYYGQTEASVYVTSYGYTVFDPHGLDMGRKIDTEKWAVWGYLIDKPGSAEWEANKMISDPDSDVYENRTLSVAVDARTPESTYW